MKTAFYCNNPDGRYYDKCQSKKYPHGFVNSNTKHKVSSDRVRL